MTTCTHPQAQYTNRGAGVLNACPDCRDRICLRCKDVAPESWMSGLCHGCYRITSEEARRERAAWAEETRLRNLADAWDEGRGSMATGFLEPTDNPYRAQLEALQE